MATNLILEYDGSPFCGWAQQPGLKTVEGELTRALETILRRVVKLTVAGRTDRGVHALGQVVSYLGPQPSLRSLNAVLPNEIAVIKAEEVPDTFSALYDAKSRSYIYRLYRRSAPSPFELGLGSCGVVHAVPQPPPLSPTKHESATSGIIHP